MDEIKVSICVAYYNRADKIKESIGSLLAQDFDSFEVVVVNDGSSDPLTAMYLDQLKDEKLTVIHQENAGFVSAMKKAIEHSKGQYIAIHGAGDISLKNRISVQSKFLDSHPDVGAVSCHFQNIVIGGDMDGFTRLAGSTKHVITVKDFLGMNNPFGHGEVMYRKSIYLKVGGYREFFKHAQDRDLWLRMIDHCEMRVIQSVLYERGLFMSDGIATNRNKLVLQKYLASFAKQNYLHKKSTGVDLLEKYGANAGLFRKRSKHISNFLSMQSIESYYKREKETAKTLAKMSIDEGVYLKSFIAISIVKLSNLKILDSLFRVLIGLHPKSKTWYKK